jgi:hypothetical protein
MRLNPLATLVPEKKPRLTFCWKLGRCWSWSGYFGEDIVLLLLPRFEPRTFLLELDIYI